MKVLFLCPDYFGIYKVIEKEIHNYMNCDVKLVIFEDYQYKNTFQKLQNFLAKTFLKKNLKKIWASKERVSTIAENDSFDFLFIICPDFLLNEELKYVTERAKKSIVYYWDSFDNITRYERTLPFFDKKYSFEPKDVERFWPLAEFMVTEALKYSGEYASSKHIYDYLKKDLNYQTVCILKHHANFLW